MLLALGVIVARVKRPAVVPTEDLRSGAAPDVRDRWTRVWWALAAGLALVPVLRAAGWVVVPCVLVAIAAASLAAADGRRWGELWAGLGAVWARLPLGPVLAIAGAGRGASFGPVARGSVLAGVLLLVFVPLLASADMAFAKILDELAPSFDLPAVRVIVIAAFVMLGGALLFVAVAPFRPRRVEVRRTLGRAEWALPLGALVVVLGAFVLLQLATLFAGDRHVLDTAGLTYAEYARSGFAQLIVVAALTLAVIAAAGRWARDGGTLLRVLLAALCLLTLVVLASALDYGLYEEAYGFTRLRFAARAAILLWLGALFVLVLVARGAHWLPRAVLTVTLASVVAVTQDLLRLRLSGRRDESSTAATMAMKMVRRIDKFTLAGRQRAGHALRPGVEGVRGDLAAGVLAERVRARARRRRAGGGWRRAARASPAGTISPVCSWRTRPPAAGPHCVGRDHGDSLMEGFVDDDSPRL